MQSSIALLFAFFKFTDMEMHFGWIALMFSKTLDEGKILLLKLNVKDSTPFKK